ncbi:hypothetical protein [Edaphobacter bradus]|uniref:hypothetical protein n=1 Tax=Edaphobacter bradus TaxID=2259016 RepID=UPI0021DFE571|nr:hypothetical protein [Edaphobacter bradus]
MPELSGSNVSDLWLAASKLASASRGKEINNLVVNVTDLNLEEDLENQEIRATLDASLLRNGKFAVSTVASTIFPKSLFRANEPRHAFYERYLRLWPRIVSYSQNRRGTYFQRLIGYPSGNQPTFNQLEFVIDAYLAGTRRRSALQCAILNPPIDLNPTPYQGFPCMQQISFHPENNGRLRITALYPMQYLWARAYGNYLGLIDLGRFVASGMGLTLGTMTCIAVVAKLDEPNILRATGLLDEQ